MHKLASVIERLEKLITDTWQRLLMHHPSDELQAVVAGDDGDPFLQACANVRAWENARPKERALLSDLAAAVERIKADPELYERVKAHIGDRRDIITVREYGDDDDNHGEPAHIVYASEAARRVKPAEKVIHKILTFESATQKEIDAECARIEAEAGDNVTVQFTIARVDCLSEEEEAEMRRARGYTGPEPKTPAENISKPEKPRKRRKRAKKKPAEPEPEPDPVQVATEAAAALDRTADPATQRAASLAMQKAKQAEQAAEQRARRKEDEERRRRQFEAWQRGEGKPLPPWERIYP